MGFFEVVVEYLGSHPYLHALAIFILAILVAEFLLIFFKYVVENIVKKTKTDIDSQIVFRIEHPIIVIVILVGLLLSVRRMLESAFLFENLIVTIIIFILAYMFIGVSSILISYWQKTRAPGKSQEFHDEIIPLMKSLIKIIISMIALVVILQLWGVQVAALLASIGVVGIILGFAFQDTMKNIFGGIALISDNSLKKHDVIMLESEEIGEVVEVSLRSTKLKTLDNDYLIIPNGALSTSKFINYALPTATMRLTIPVGVAYGSNPEEVRRVLLGTLKGRNDIMSLPRREVRFVKMNDFSMDFQLLFYIKNYKERYSISDSITTEVYNALCENGITIPFPTRTLYTSHAKHSPKEKLTKNKSKTRKTIKKSVRTPVKKNIKKTVNKVSKKKVSKNKK